MSELKYKVGDKVRIKSLDWYNENKNKYGRVPLIYSHGAKFNFLKEMSTFCGKEMTITEVDDYECKYYEMKEDGGDYHWTDEMIEGLVEEEEMSLDKAGQITDFEYEGLAYTLPEGYQFKDENGNIINATKIVLEKKKKEYPNTYEECCKVLGVSEFEYNHTGTKVWYRHKLMATLDKLMLCRDAYWKLYGEDMGLGKPWKPDWNDTSIKYCLERDFDAIDKNVSNHKGRTFAFPTEEMRDAFKENFDPDIEICKELL